MGVWKKLQLSEISSTPLHKMIYKDVNVLVLVFFLFHIISP